MKVAVFLLQSWLKSVFTTMFTFALLSACLLSVGSARGLQTTAEEVASDTDVKQALKEMLANAPSKELMERAAEQFDAFREDLKADPNLLEELEANVAAVGEALSRGHPLNPTKSLATLMLAANPVVFEAPGSLGRLAKTSRNVDAMMDAEEPPASLKDLAKKLNPVIGYFDPLALGTGEFWDQSNEATVGFLRHAEIKHGRVAMAAFVGYLAQSNGFYFPWKLTGDTYFKDIAAAGSPPDQWDALPQASKLQILLFIGFLEFWSESSYVLEQDGSKHYMRGGQPGKFPSFNELPHPVPFNLWDPFKLAKGKNREKLDKSLLAEVNNGRLAMIGIMGFLAEQKVPGAVPFLKDLVKPYAGEVMAPFFVESDFKLF